MTLEPLQITCRWVLRDCYSGEVLLAHSRLGATENDLLPLLEEAARSGNTLKLTFTS